MTQGTEEAVLWMLLSNDKEWITDMLNYSEEFWGYIYIEWKKKHFYMCQESYTYGIMFP